MSIDKITPENVANVLNTISMYIVYFYPGLISLGLYKFARRRNYGDIKNTVIKCVAISFLYVQVVSFFTKLHVEEFTIKIQFYLVLISIILPVVLIRIMRIKYLKVILRFFGISTSFGDTDLDILQEQSHALTLSVYMDKLGIMYHGSLRIHGTDPQGHRTITLSGYSISKLNKETNTYETTFEDYFGNNDEYVILPEEVITRIEVEIPEKVNEASGGGSPEGNGASGGGSPAGNGVS